MTDTNNSTGTNGFDRFLRTLPPTGGLDVLAFFKPVKYVKYYFTEEQERGRTVSKLWKVDWNPATAKWEEEKPFLVGTNLYGLVFKRRDISTPVIELVVARNQGQFVRGQRTGVNDEAAEAEAEEAESGATPPAGE